MNRVKSRLGFDSPYKKTNPSGNRGESNTKRSPGIYLTCKNIVRATTEAKKWIHMRLTSSCFESFPFTSIFNIIHMIQIEQLISPKAYVELNHPE